jgi:hypothetical protein
MDWKKGLITSLEVTTFFRIADGPIPGHFWYDADGNETDDPEQVAVKEEVKIPAWRLVETPDEFRLVYEREFNRTGMEVSDASHALFIDILKKHIKALIEKHLSNREYETTDFKVIAAAESFLNYLNPAMFTNPKPLTTLAETVHTRLVDTLPYDVQNYRLFSFDNVIRINYHFNEGDDPHAFKIMVFARENIELEIEFERQFLIANEQEAIALLDKQFSLIGVTGTPAEIWLANVEAIIAYHGLMKRVEYAKNDAVKLWFNKKRDELQAYAPDVPFIGELFHRNLNINQTVTDAYYRLVRQPRNRDEISKAYVDPLHHHNSPYQRSIYGAFINMDTLALLEMYRHDKIPPYDQITDKQIEAALQDYSVGFKKGYYEFDPEILEKNPFQDAAHKARIIFDFVTGGWHGAGTLPTTHGRADKNFLAGWKDAGYEGGQLYRAWYLILQNHALFEPMFKAGTLEGAKKNIKVQLSVDQVAIMRLFNNEPVTKENHNEIALQYGHTSGHKLYLRYNWYAKGSNRKASESSIEKLLNKIKRFEGVVPYVIANRQSKILDEITALEHLKGAFD